jgi:hypothetical protein
LAATTSDIKARVRRVIGELEGIEQQQDPIFASPRDVLLDLVLATHELEAAVMKMCARHGGRRCSCSPSF